MPQNMRLRQAHQLLRLEVWRVTIQSSHIGRKGKKSNNHHPGSSASDSDHRVQVGKGGTGGKESDTAEMKGMTGLGLASCQVPSPPS